jgi:hypothetical protein
MDTDREIVRGIAVLCTLVGVALVLHHFHISWGLTIGGLLLLLGVPSLVADWRKK